MIGLSTSGGSVEDFKWTCVRCIQNKMAFIEDTIPALIGCVNTDFFRLNSTNFPIIFVYLEYG